MWMTTHKHRCGLSTFIVASFLRIPANLIHTPQPSVDFSAMDYAFFARPSIVAFTASILLLIAYFIGLALYRLYLSPLARFPGPKFAALTRWYEFYYDVVLQGQFIFQIQKMHKKYGAKILFLYGQILLIKISRPDCPHHTI
jgi:hypothetical protein